MEWKVVAAAPDYAVSEDGMVKRLTRGGRRYPVGYVLAPRAHVRGYVTYNLATTAGDRSFLAHRLVAEAFIGPAPTERHEVAHNDGSRTNNHWRNLRWATPKENQDDRKAHGTWLTGERCGSAKATDAAAEQIRKKYAAGGRRFVGGAVTMQDLAAEHGLSLAQISRIVNGKQREADRAA